MRLRGPRLYIKRVKQFRYRVTKLLSSYPSVRMTAFHNWLDALEKRYLADLAFQEVSTSVRALSADYVERRARITQGRVLSGAGKRAAFALFYGPLHFLLVDRIAE